MKSKSAEFSCSGCWFADLAGQFDEESWQIGCEADRDALFTDPITGRTDFKDFPKYRSLDRFCNMYRTIEWGMSFDDPATLHSLAPNGGILEIARKQVAPSFGLCIFDSPDNTIEQTCETLDSIVEASKNYDEKKVGVMVSFGPDKSLGDTLHITNLYNEKLRIRGVTHAYHSDDVEKTIHRETEAFTHFAKCSYYSKLNPGDKIRADAFSSVDLTINEYLEKILAFKYGDALILDGPLVRNMYYEMNQGYDAMAASLLEKCKQEGFYTEV